MHMMVRVMMVRVMMVRVMMVRVMMVRVMMVRVMMVNVCGGEERWEGAGQGRYACGAGNLLEGWDPSDWDPSDSPLLPNRIHEE